MMSMVVLLFFFLVLLETRDVEAVDFHAASTASTSASASNLQFKY